MPDAATHQTTTHRFRRHIAGAAAALLATALGVWASAQFARTPPLAASPSPGIAVRQGSLTLAADAPQWRTIRLERVVPAGARATDPLPARVRIDETRAAKVGAPLAGRVTRVFVALGQRVAVGTPLYTVASPEIANLRAEREKASLTLAVAKTTLDRVHAMVAARALPAKEETTALQEHQQAQIALRLAERKLASLRIGRSGENEFTVQATRGGVVVEKNVLPSQEVSPSSEPLVVIADLSVVWVVAEPYEADMTKLREGQTAVITSPSLPGVSLAGVVEMVSAVVDPERHTIPVRVRVDNRDLALKPNMYAQVRFAVAPGTSAVEVPATALVTDGAHQYVYVQEQARQFARREVVVGSLRDGRVPVLAGLHAGQTVVSDGAIFLNVELELTH